VCWCSAVGATSEPTTGPSGSTAPLNHPDGLIGRFSLHGRFSYASVSVDDDAVVNDVLRYSVGLGWVLHRRFSLHSDFEARRQDSTRFELSGGIRLYSKDPLAAPVANADGPVGGPVLRLSGGARYSGSSSGAVRAVGEAGVLVPVSTKLSLAAGWRFYEAIETSDITRVFGSVSLYFSRYFRGGRYLNPDGPPGYLATRILAGGSSRGYNGRLEFILPLEQTTSLKVLLGAERNELLNRKTLKAGIGVALYPLGH
jgi:hypothetical protein